MKKTYGVLPCLGQRVEATRRISWTLHEFDDYPLIVESGDRGTVTEVSLEQKKICVEWDKDHFKHMKKRISLDTEPDLWPLKVIK